MTEQRYSLDQLLALMTRLRDPQLGCPWDKQQSFETIAPHTIEEAYELADAINRGDMAHIREELGDVLFQVVFYSQLGAEQQQFTFSDVIHQLVEKLLRRHPHVFPDGSLGSRPTSAEQDLTAIKNRWEDGKAEERRQKQQGGLLDDIPLALPAMSRAVKLQKRASAVGFDWPDAAGAMMKLREELAELEQVMLEQSATSAASVEVVEEFGDLLFSCGNLARKLGLEPESALRGANRKFEQRFNYIEQQLSMQGLTVEQASLQQMDALWDDAKRQC